MSSSKTNNNSNNNNNNNNANDSKDVSVVEKGLQALTVKDKPVDFGVYEDRVDVVTLAPDDALRTRDKLVGNKANIVFKTIMQTSDICSRSSDYAQLDTIEDVAERTKRRRHLSAQNAVAIREMININIAAIATALVIVSTLRTLYQKAKIEAMMHAGGKFLTRAQYMKMGFYKLAYSELIPLLFGAFNIDDVRDWDNPIKFPEFYAYLGEPPKSGEMMFRPNVTENNVDEERIAITIANLLPIVVSGNSVLTLLSDMVEYDDEEKNIEKLANVYLSAHYPLIRVGEEPVAKEGGKVSRYEKFLFNQNTNLSLAFTTTRNNFATAMVGLTEDKMPKSQQQFDAIVVEYAQKCTNQKVTCLTSAKKDTSIVAKKAPKKN